MNYLKKIAHFWYARLDLLHICSKLFQKKTKNDRKKYIISVGTCHTLGATIEKDGVNFALWCPEAAAIELLLFKDVNDDSPYVISLESKIFKSTYYWHVKVIGIGAGQIYAYRITKGIKNSRFAEKSIELNKVLLDPYGKRVLFPDGYRRWEETDEKVSCQKCA